MPLEDLQGPDPRGIVNCSALAPTDLPAGAAAGAKYFMST